MSHSQFNFKSSGVRTDNRQFTTKKTHLRPIGIKTPLESDEGLFKTHTNPVAQIADNFRNLIMTNNGERLGRYNFGANLKAVVFEYSNSPKLESVIIEAIIDVTQKYIPLIEITNVNILELDINEKNDLNEFGVANLKLMVEYRVPKFRSAMLGLEVDLKFGG